MKSLGSLFFKEDKKAKFLSDEPGQTLPSLVKTGFKINKENWSSDEGYYVDKCTQEGCAQYTYDMIGDKFGDAWQAYKSFDAYLNVSSSTVKKMEVLFNNINKVGFPSLNEETQNDIAAKNLLISLTPNQNQFKNLELGSVVGLYYPNSSNYDLAFFESAIGKAKDNEGNWVSIKNPYFCTDPSNFEKTKWTLKDIKSDKTFKASPTLKGGKSFVPNTHLGFIGYIDDRGERYVVHNVHKTVYAYPISKMVAGKTLSIIWSGSPVK
jgi:predicted RNA-binding protein with PUA-like domain